jgi:hypothetical protein
LGQEADGLPQATEIKRFSLNPQDALDLQKRFRRNCQQWERLISYNPHRRDLVALQQKRGR